MICVFLVFKRLNEIDERLMTFKEQVIESVEEQIKSKVTQIVNKKVSDSGNMTKNSEEIINNKVSGNYGSESNIEVKSENNNDIIKNVVLENKVVNIESDDEVLVGVEFNKGMVVSIDKLERESLQVEGLQRVNFPQVYCEPRCLQMLLLKGKSPLVLEDMRSSNCSLNFCDDLVPSAWDGRESVRWRYGERYFEREWYLDGEIELFKVGRNYKELVERLDVERVDNYLPYLPCVETDIAAVNEDNVDDSVTYLTLTENIKGEFTIPNVDRNFELIVCNNICSYYIDTMEKSNDDDYYNYNSNMYLIVNDLYSSKIRLLFDDGG